MAPENAYGFVTSTLNCSVSLSHFSLRRCFSVSLWTFIFICLCLSGSVCLSLDVSGSGSLPRGAVPLEGSKPR